MTSGFHMAYPLSSPPFVDCLPHHASGPGQGSLPKFVGFTPFPSYSLPLHNRTFYFATLFSLFPLPPKPGISPLPPSSSDAQASDTARARRYASPDSTFCGCSSPLFFHYQHCVLAGKLSSLVFFLHEGLGPLSSKLQHT